MARELALIEAPSNLGLAPPAPGTEPGVRHMARVLRELGLRTTLGAIDAGEVVPPRYVPERDAATGVRNVREIADYSEALAHAIGGQRLSAPDREHSVDVVEHPRPRHPGHGEGRDSRRERGAVVRALGVSRLLHPD
jgi:hypothetical protein